MIRHVFLRGVLAAIVLSTAGLSGCAVSASDVKRWESTERGPEKLYAVITHDKYAIALRTEAALSLVRMRPRAGQRIGLKYLIDGYDAGADKIPGALAALKEEPRQRIVVGMTPELVKQIGAPPPQRRADGALPPDASIPYKDVAFGMLSHEPTFVTDEGSRQAITQALIAWSQAAFEDRLENPAQAYGVEAMMRFLGAPAVKALPTLLNESTTKLDRIAGLIADLGDAETKAQASAQLVALAKALDAPAWRDKQIPLVRDANNRAGQKATDEQVKGQVLKFQDQELTKVFAAMKRVGGRAVIDYCLAYAAQKDASEERRKAALAAIEGRVDKNNPNDIDRLYAVAKDDATPDAVRDLAFNRLGELPKELVLPKLYALFATKKWKVRWVAASLVLKGMKTQELGEFMAHLPKAKVGMSEPITYGGFLQKMEGTQKPRDAIEPYLRDREPLPKLVAVGFYYGGKKADVDVILPLEKDKTPVPKCDKDDECGWICNVPKSPGSQEQEEKTVSTVGDFVKFCVMPSMTAQ